MRHAFVHQSVLECLESRRLLALVPTIELVKDINQVEGASTTPYEAVQVGQQLFFRNGSAETGLELWKTDGSINGGVLVKDINPGAPGSSPQNLVSFGDRLVFRAFHPLYGDELWASDGTPAGTDLLKDVTPGIVGSYYSEFTPFDGKLYFLAWSKNVDAGLWETDGTAHGTKLVQKVSFIGASLTPDLEAVGDTLFFTSFVSGQGMELWRTDGSPGGATLVKDISPGGYSGEPRYMTNVGGTLFFSAHTLASGRELWKSDGTADGTVMIEDATPGSSDTAMDNFTAAGSMLFYEGYTPGYGLELHRSDGTAAGTLMLKDIAPGTYSTGIRDMAYLGDGVVVFGAGDEGATSGIKGNELWRSDGTAAGTYFQKDIYPGGFGSNISNFRKVGGRMFFSASNSTYGQELWSTDGTAGGTLLVKDINPGADGSRPFYFYDFNDELWFGAHEPMRGHSLWTSDGTRDGTLFRQDLVQLTNDSSISRMINVNGTLFFAADDGVSNYAQLWKSDGTPEGTVMLKEGLVNFTSAAQGQIDFNGKLLFLCQNQLWISDGTPAGTVPVMTSSGFGWLGNLAQAGSLAYFTTGNSSNATTTLWKTDGTPEGTSVVRNFAGGTNADINNLADINGTLYFAASDGASGSELWRSDGTPEGTVMVADIHPGAGSSAPATFKPLADGTFVFTADDGASGTEIWRSDGTAGGTMRLKDIRAGASGSSPAKLTVLDDKVFFTANDGTWGQELWRTDGTTAGTVLVRDTANGSTSGSPDYFVIAGGKLFFAARSALWRSDGTADGTQIVRSISIVNMSAVGENVFFNGWTDNAGWELWKSDGTSAGTFLVTDLTAGAISYSIAPLPVDVNGTGYFRDSNGLTGGELYRVVHRDVPPPSVTSAAFDASAARRQELRLAFNSDVGTSLLAADLRLQNLTTNSSHTLGALGKSLDAAGATVATWHTLGPALPDGNYRATILAADVENAAGVKLAADYTFDFFVLAGDANCDRRVDVSDRAILQAHLGQTNATFSQGDFNYDGAVNAADEALLDGNWHVWLAAPGALTVGGTAGDDAFRLQNDSNNSSIGIGIGSITWRVPVSGVTSLVFDGGAGDDALAAPLGGLAQMAGRSITFLAGAGAADTLTVTATASWEIINFSTASAAATGGLSIIHAGVEQAALNTGGGLDIVNVLSGPDVTLLGTPVLQSLSLSSGTSATLALADDAPLVTSALSLAPTARLDARQHDIIIDHGGATPIGSWNGSAYTGITGHIAAGAIYSSLAQQGLTTLALAEASDVLSIAGAETAVWDRRTVDATSLLIKYTYAGDANLDGVISGDDYSAIDFSVQVPGASGWYLGDFNYDGIVSGDDYSLIDFVIAAQADFL